MCWGTPLLICLFMVENFIGFCNYKVGKVWPHCLHTVWQQPVSGRVMILHKTFQWQFTPLTWVLGTCRGASGICWVRVPVPASPVMSPAMLEFPPNGRDWGLLAQLLLFAGFSYLTCVVLAPRRCEQEDVAIGISWGTSGRGGKVTREKNR